MPWRALDLSEEEEPLWESLNQCSWAEARLPRGEQLQPVHNKPSAIRMTSLRLPTACHHTPFPRKQ